jgi:hypothetical protein
MKYQANLPEEPDGPLWDQHGRKYVKLEAGHISAKKGYRVWELVAPTEGETPYYTWAELITSVDYLRDNAQAVENWQNAKTGGFYWVEGKEGGFLRDVKGVAIATQARTLRVPSTRDIFDDGILGEDDQDNFYEVTPVLAVPADVLIELFSTDEEPTIDHLQAEIYDWLEDHPQIHWKERSK